MHVARWVLFLVTILFLDLVMIQWIHWIQWKSFRKSNEFFRFTSVQFLQTRNVNVKPSSPRIISVGKMLLRTKLEHINSTTHPLGTLNTSYVGGNWAWFSQYESYKSAIDNHLYVKQLLLYTKGTFYQAALLRSYSSPTQCRTISILKLMDLGERETQRTSKHLCNSITGHM